MKDDRITGDELRGYQTMEWLRTLDTVQAFSHIATWLQYTIYERKMDVQDTISMMVELLLQGLSRRLLEEENDRER